MSNKAYLEAVRRAEAKATDPEIIRARERARARYARSKIATQPSSIAAATGAEILTALVGISASGPVAAAAVCGHGTVGANSELKICDRCRDSIRWTGRVPSGLSEDAQIAVEKIVLSGVIKPARKKPEIRAAQEKESSSSVQQDGASPTKTQLMREVVDATSGGRNVIEIKPNLPPDVNLEDPAQRKHLANCILLKGVNYEAGTRMAYPMLKPAEAASVAFHVQTDKSFQGDLQEAASVRGVSENDKAAFISILWRYAASTKPQDYQDRGTALRLLAKVFLPEGAPTPTMQSLPLVGLEAGLREMGIDGNLPLPDANDATGFPQLEQFVEESEEETEE